MSGKTSTRSLVGGRGTLIGGKAQDNRAPREQISNRALRDKHSHRATERRQHVDSRIDFINDSPPVRTCPQCELRFSEQESSVIAAELPKLLSQGVIMRATCNKNEFISNIFIRPKSNGKYRPIHNWAKLNENINYRHFKMQSLNTAMHLISKNCYFASVDMCDAYYSIPIASELRKYLRFT